MADQNGRTITDLIASLCKEGDQYQFQQATRIIHLIREESERQDKPLGLDILPELSLSFPEADIDSVDFDPEEGVFHIVTTFMALYGVSSPLPTFYTEDLLDAFHDDLSVGKDFIDIIHRMLYRHLIDGWVKHKLDMQVYERKELKQVNRLFSMLGLADKNFQNSVKKPYSLTRYISLFSHQPRSACGLRVLLSDYFDVPVQIISGYQRMVAIPKQQHARLGMENCTLGQDMCIGEEVKDRMGNILIHIGPVKKPVFDQFTYQKGHFSMLKFLAEFYLTTPIDCYVEIELDYTSVRPCQLGKDAWARLGESSWLGKVQHMQRKMCYRL